MRQLIFFRKKIISFTLVTLVFTTMVFSFFFFSQKELFADTRCPSGSSPIGEACFSNFSPNAPVDPVEHTHEAGEGGQDGGEPTVIQLLADGVPGVKAGQGLSQYLQAMFQLGLGIAVVLAVLQIVIGGFQYMTSDAAGGKSEGTSKIWGAIQGLILALATVLILQTINPQILSLKINFGPGNANPSGGGGAGTTNEGSPEERAARNALSSAGIGINNPPCASGQTTGCTNVAGLPQNTVGSLGQLKTDCNCDLTITGGTESGHATHGVGLPVVDLRKDPKFSNYIGRAASCIADTSLGTLYRVGSSNYVDEGDHWHSCIGSACNITGHTGTC